MAKPKKTNTKEIKKNAMVEKEIGSTSLMASLLSGIVNTQELDQDLRGKNGVLKFNEMRLNDGTVQAALFSIKLPILSARWYINAASEDTRDKEIADFVEHEIFTMMTTPFHQWLWEALNYLPFGHYVFEKIFTFREDGKVGLKKLAPRLPETILQWQTKDGESGITQLTAEKGETSIPIWKLIILTHQKEGDNWEGISIFRAAYKHWYAKKCLYLIDLISTERQGVGIPYAKKPTGATPEDVSKIVEILKNIRANERAYELFEDGWEIGFMDMKAHSVKDAMPSIQHHDRQIIKSILAQFLDLGANSTGSYALSKDQSSMFLMSLEASVNYICSVFNNFVIKQLVDFNFDNVENYPQLTAEKIDNVDMNTISTALQRLVQTGVLTPDEEIERVIRDLMNLPEKPEEEDIDPTMYDDILEEVNSKFEAVIGEGEESAPQDAVDEMSDEELVQEAMEHGLGDLIEGGARGVPLSEETKRKISEALKKWHSSGKGGKGKGKKKADPAIKQKRQAIKELRKQIREFNEDAKEELLEKAARGEKVSKKQREKMRLKLHKKKREITQKIDTLQDEIDALRGSEMTGDQIFEAKERVDKILDQIEKDEQKNNKRKSNKS